MRHFGVLLLFFAIISVVAFLDIAESRHGNHRGDNHHHDYPDYDHTGSMKNMKIFDERSKERKLPRVIRRKYFEYSKAPRDFTAVYHTIPITLEHIKDDIFYLTAPYRVPRHGFLSIQIYIEFSGIEKSDQLVSNEFLMDIIPIIGSRVMAQYDNDCSILTIVSRPHFPDGELEIKYDVTSLYQACQAKDKSPSLLYRIRFYPLNNTTNLNLIRDKVNVFFLFREVGDKSDIMTYLPSFQHLGPLNYHTIMAHDRRHRRRPRSLNQPRKAPKPCSHRPYIFSFEISGWDDFIAAPKEYGVNKCHGRCAFPLAPNLNYTNYAVVKAIGSTIYKELKNPSCVAQDFTPALIVVLEGDKYTMKTQEDMVAASCRCC